MPEMIINCQCSDCGKCLSEKNTMYVYDVKTNSYDCVCAKCAIEYHFDDYEERYTKGETEYVYGADKYIEPYAASMDFHDIMRCDSCGHLFDMIDCGHYTNDGRTICDGCYEQMGYDECDNCCIAFPSDKLIHHGKFWVCGDCAK